MQRRRIVQGTYRLSAAAACKTLLRKSAVNRTGLREYHHIRQENSLTPCTPSQRAYRERKVRQVKELEHQLCQADKEINELRTELQNAKGSSARITAENRKLRGIVEQLLRNSLAQVPRTSNIATSPATSSFGRNYSMDSVHTTADQNSPTFGFSQWRV